MKETVTCEYCKGLVHKEDAVYFKDNYYHKGCYESVEDRTKFLRYACALFRLKQPSPKICKQMGYFINKGISYKRMYQALYYFYDVQKNDIYKAKNGIGIIPYVVEDSDRYFKYKEEKEQKIKEELLQQIQQTPVNMLIKENKEDKENKNIYNIE